MIYMLCYWFKVGCAVVADIKFAGGTIISPLNAGTSCVTVIAGEGSGVIPGARVGIGQFVAIFAEMDRLSGA